MVKDSGAVKAIQFDTVALIETITSLCVAAYVARPNTLSFLSPTCRLGEKLASARWSDRAVEDGEGEEGNGAGGL